MAGKEKQSEGKARLGGPGSKLDPAQRAGIVSGLKVGDSVNQLAARHSVSRTTVQMLREVHADDLPNWKRKTAAVLMSAASKLAARLDIDADTQDASLKDRSIAAGILLDKIGGLNSEPAQIVEHRHELGQTFGGWLGNSPPNTAPVRTIDAEVIESAGKGAESSSLGNARPNSDLPNPGTSSAGAGAGGGKKSPSPTV
jgi:hypothetical protein